MTPFKAYISFDREIRNHKDGLHINTAEATYWLNKAIEEFTDKKYAEFETSEDISQDLKGLYTPARLDIFVSDPDSTFPNAVYGTLPTSLRYITNERCTITVSGTDVITKVTPSTLDTFSVKKLRDPYGQHILHHSTANPLRLIEGDKVYLMTDGNYTIKYYDVKYLKDPTPFTILSAAVTTTLTEFPHKAYKEIIAIAVRMCLENNSNNRYNTYNFEEKKTEL